jgi:hypothetical protein
VRHGVLSNRFLARHEDREAFERLRNDLIAEVSPETRLQSILVERLAMLFWRERRLAAAEAEQVERQHDDANDPFSGNSFKNIPLTTQLLVGRYQWMLGRQIKEAINELLAVQERIYPTIEMQDRDFPDCDDNIS